MHRERLVIPILLGPDHVDVGVNPGLGHASEVARARDLAIAAADAAVEAGGGGGETAAEGARGTGEARDRRARGDEGAGEQEAEADEGRRRRAAARRSHEPLDHRREEPI